MNAIYRIARRRAALSLRQHHPTTPCTPASRTVARRTLVSAPKSGDGPLMERRADRELPDITGFRWGRTLPVFGALIALASVAIFNYQKLSSPVVASTLYALRVSPAARDLLGGEIYFYHSIPWISGEMNQVRGRIDVSFRVRGSRGDAVMRFASFRPSPRGVFETTQWTLTTDDGRVVDLLAESDPFSAMTGAANLHGDGGDGDDLDAPFEGTDAAKHEPARGFRKV